MDFFKIDIQWKVALIFLSVILLIIGCRTSNPNIDSYGNPYTPGYKSVESITKSYDTDSSEEVKFKTTLIISFVPGKEQRKSMEDALVKLLIESGAGAVASYQALLPEKEITKEFLKEQLKDTGIDSVLTVSLIDMGTDKVSKVEKDIQPGADEVLPAIYGERDLYGYYHNMGLPRNRGNFDVKNSRVQVDVKLFEAVDGKEVWYGNFKVFNKSYKQIVKSIGSETLSRLKELKFIN